MVIHSPRLSFPFFRLLSCLICFVLIEGAQGPDAPHTPSQRTYPSLNSSETSSPPQGVGQGPQRVPPQVPSADGKPRPQVPPRPRPPDHPPPLSILQKQARRGLTPLFPLPSSPPFPPLWPFQPWSRSLSRRADRPGPYWATERSLHLTSSRSFHELLDLFAIDISSPSTPPPSTPPSPDRSSSSPFS